MKNWLKIDAELAQTPPDWSVYTEIFGRFGMRDTIQEDSPPTLTGYIAECILDADRLNILCNELKVAGVIRSQVSIVQEQNWAEAWKQYFKPKNIGKIWTICPSWETIPLDSDRILITLDPGQAFGTGDHPTTRMCLELLEKAHVKDREVADIGSGSGILSVAACLLDAKEVLAVDNDPIAVEASRENAERNSVHYENLLGCGFEPVPSNKSFDLILSNIISAAIIQLIPDVIRRLRPGGEWIVSGIIEQNWPDVHSRIEKAGFKWVKEMREGEWIAAICHR